MSIRVYNLVVGKVKACNQWIFLEARWILVLAQLRCQQRVHNLVTIVLPITYYCRTRTWMLWQCGNVHTIFYPVRYYNVQQTGMPISCGPSGWFGLPRVLPYQRIQPYCHSLSCIPSYQYAHTGKPVIPGRRLSSISGQPFASDGGPLRV